MPGAEHRARQQFIPLERIGVRGTARQPQEKRGNGQAAHPEIHYGGTPIVTVRLVNGVPQDIPHLFVDNRGGQTRWWIEREPIESWQKWVQAVKESSDERFRDISPDTIPSSVVHTYADIPQSVRRNQPAYEHREWVTFSYSLSPNKQGEIYEHTFLNTPPVSAEEPTTFSQWVTVRRHEEVEQIHTTQPTDQQE